MKYNERTTFFLSKRVVSPILRAVNQFSNCPQCSPYLRSLTICATNLVGCPEICRNADLTLHHNLNLISGKYWWFRCNW